MRIRPRLVLLYMLLLVMMGSAAHAHAEHRGPFEIFSHSCILKSDTPIAFEEAERSTQWNCSPDFRTADAPYVWLRFQLPADSAPELALRGMAAPIDRFTLLARNTDGQMVRTVFEQQDLRRWWTPGNYFAAPLPRDILPESTVYVELQHPSSRLMATELSIQPEVIAESERINRTFLYAACFGILIAVAVLSGLLGYFMHSLEAALHAIFCLCGAGYVLSASSLIFIVVPDLPLWSRLAINYGLLGLGVMLVAPILYLHLEKGIMTRAQKIGLVIAALGSLVAALTLPSSLLFGFKARMVFNLAFVPFIVVMLWIIVSATRRGSRAIVSFALAWAVLTLLATERMMRGTDFYFAPMWFDYLFFFGLAFQALVMTLAIAYQTGTLRKDRDRERVTARMAIETAMTDPLTRLPNRRDFERFDWSRANFVGFIDIDRFKQINDTYGHDVGDQVLQLMARSFGADDATGLVRTWRLGGEEFAFAMRAPSIEAAATAFNRMRNAASAELARKLPQIERAVTVSAGLVAMGPEARQSFRAADMALYRAKSSGRNRLCYETASGGMTTMFPANGNAQAA